MKLVILSQYYPPEIGAPQRRLSDLARRMVEAGHEVTILTAMPNYPVGKIQSGYGGLLKREEIDGIKIIRTFIYPTQKAGLISRLMNYFSFVFSSILIGSFVLRRADYLLVESPPLFLGLAGYWLSRLKRMRLIFNVSDLWPESAVLLGVLRPGSRAYKLGAWLEKFCYRKAWVVTGQSKTILASINERFPNTKTFHLSNGVDVGGFGLDQPSEAVRATLIGDAAKTQTIALYAGLHGLAQGLDQILDAAEKLRDHADMRFVLIGDGPEKQALVENARQRNIDNVVFIDPMPSSAIPARLAAADILLVTLKLYLPGAVPSKLYEAMASHKPVILVASGEAAEIINRYQAGIAVEPGDIEGLTRALQTLRNDPVLRNQMAAHGRRAVEEDFDRAKIAARFIEYLEASR